MSHGFDITEAGREFAEPEEPPYGHPVLLAIDRALRTINALVMIPCMIALVASALVLTHSVVARYFLKIPTDWQDEMAIFLLVGTTFFSAAYVQSFRGHVGIEALAEILPERVNSVRMVVVDLVSFLFCAFFCWKSWTLFLEALHEGQTTTSTWGPPLWIPYSLMAAGMTLLSIQLLVEFLSRVTPVRRPS
jgi:TRAP-type C4-dicarboxylate transport system permease small subunit